LKFHVLIQGLLTFIVSDGLSAGVPAQIERSCVVCHNKETSEGGLDLTALSFELDDPAVRERWVRIHDRVEKGEMPPTAGDLPEEARTALVNSLKGSLHEADLAEVRKFGRGPMRRLTREEYEQNLRDLLQLPLLDIRDMLPEDREKHHFNKTSESLDISRVQLAAYLDAAEAALGQAMASGAQPPPSTSYRAVSTNLFAERSTFGEREAMFFAKENKALDNSQLDALKEDPAIELALFRSAHWPYYGYPRGFTAKLSGEYRVRFSARAVVQLKGYELRPAAQPVPMTFRARMPSGPDVSGDVRATGGIIDIQPAVATYETTIRLRQSETFEYSLLGLPVPLARNVNNGPPEYRYPPLPEGGQPGVAFQWLEVEGPLSSPTWPPPSHRVLFDELPIRGATGGDLPVEIITEHPQDDARRLVRQFVRRAAREPLLDEEVLPFEQLALARLEQGAAFADAVLAGDKAFLCSGHFLYLPEPHRDDEHYAIASRLSHFLTNSRPDAELLEQAQQGRLRGASVLRAQTDRLIASPGFERFVTHFTDSWLGLRHLHRDEPDIRLYPEYRFDSYLVESMERETRAYFRAMVQENLPASSLVDSEFAFVNDRLTAHYGLPPLGGSSMRKVSLPADSPYGGLLTQAAILKVTANGTSTSPVIRGAWIMDRLIGEPPPPPPPNIPAVEPDIRGASTIRDLLSAHTKSSACAACHARFDPVGLALENFDIFGSWRTQYRRVDASGSITGIDRAGHDFAYAVSGPVDASGKLLNGKDFRDIQELKALLIADSRQLARNVLHQLTIYATGAPVRFSDRREIETVLDACMADGYRAGDLLFALVQSKIFLGPAGCRTP
jgi:hypothetical protein